MGSTLRIFSGSLGFSYIHCPPSLLSGHNLSLAELAKLPTTQWAVTHHPSLIYLVFLLVFKEVSFGTISVALDQPFSSITLLSSIHVSPARLAKYLAYFQAVSASSQCRSHPPHSGHVFLMSRFIVLGRLVNPKKSNFFNHGTLCPFLYHLHRLFQPHTPLYLVLLSHHQYLYIWTSLFSPHYMIRISSTFPQHIDMESIHTPHTLPSTFIQTRLQGHTHAYLILFTSPTTQIYNFQKASILLNYFINPHTTGSSSLYSQLIKKSASPSLPTLVPNLHSIP
jgi:hypothetical protein